MTTARTVKNYFFSLSPPQVEDWHVEDAGMHLLLFTPMYDLCFPSRIILFSSLKQRPLEASEFLFSFDGLQTQLQQLAQISDVSPRKKKKTS